ncbi:hypothetical protein [Arthrobacter woluwensis]|uniref:hypothetical protein n=1 Tax=Arthrobacter woluwensis TaxID=156980 RepID=UPI001AAFBB57|nr:hypothetical protein [Arthrobacter woluwensis]QTF70594.1 hypothetical protein G8758_00135 [Arthrobacter woluwensis]
MTSRTIRIETGGKTYGGQIGVIRRTSLGYGDHGVFTADLAVEWSGGGVSVGGLVLDTRTHDAEHEGRPITREGTAYGLDHLIWILRTVGVDRWEQLVGKEVIVLFDGESAWGAQSVGIASTTNEYEVLILKDHADMWRERAEDQRND